MASRRKELQEDAKLRLMQIIKTNPQITSRKIAQHIGISNGSAYYLLSELIDKGFLKLKIFKKNPQKKVYLYLLTPKGIREKSLLTSAFLKRKYKEYEALKEEITFLEQETGIFFKDTKPKDN